MQSPQKLRRTLWKQGSDVPFLAKYGHRGNFGALYNKLRNVNAKKNPVSTEICRL